MPRTGAFLRMVDIDPDTGNLIGPPYQAIAARHAAQREVMEKVLATKIIVGGLC